MSGPAIAAELRRSLALGPASTDSATIAATSLTFWDDVGLGDADLQMIEVVAFLPLEHEQASIWNQRRHLASLVDVRRHRRS